MSLEITFVEENRLQSILDRSVHIAIVKDHQRRFAAQFKGDFFQVTRTAGLHDNLAYFR